MSDHLPADTSAGSTVTIQGILDRITFLNQESGYTVARLQELTAEPSGHSRNQITVVGFLSEAPVGSTLALTGNWQDDARYGRQLKVLNYTILKPNTINGIERYLGSGLIKGIGPQFAARIVNRFGLDTLDVLDRDPDRLQEVAGLGGKRVGLIKQAWQEQKEIHKVMVFLQAHAISAAYAVKIFKTYGSAALETVQRDPYRLAEDIWGVGFRIADTIAQSLGVPANDERRLRAGLLFALKEAAKGGHCFQEQAQLQESAARLLDLSVSAEIRMEEGLRPLARDKKIIADDNRVYLAPLYYAETGTAAGVRELLQSAGGYSTMVSRRGRQQLLDWVGGKMQIALAPEQQEAIIMALNSKVGVLTGGPGTGKSTILKGLILLLEREGITVNLAAPTGRAAKRLAETCGREAKTIHRLLEFDPAARRFKRNSDNPLRAEMVIIDEVSMLDITLANSLVKAVAPAASLLLVGDADQLPSVGPGNVLLDIIESAVVPVVHLNRIFRQGAGSLISFNAARVNRGEPLELLPEYKGAKDFYCIFREEQVEIEKEIISLCTGRLTAKYGFDPVRDIQVLSPMRKGLVGCDQLNNRLQDTINSGAVPGDGRMQRFREGDKVMQIRNNYDKEVFNGDLGIVAAIDSKEERLQVLVDDRLVSYETPELDELVLAYATTVHKSQGSEFPCIIMVMHPAHYPMLQRNLLYTAITRARKMVVLVGSRKAIRMAISNNPQQKRNTALCQRLITG